MNMTETAPETDLARAEIVISERKSEIEAFIGGASIAVIKDQPGYDSAVEIGRAVKTKYTETEARRRELVDPLNDVVKKINAGFKKILEPLEAFERGIKRVCMDYQQEQERIRIEAQRKADEEARRERLKIEAAARAQREKEDAARRAEEDARRKAAAEQDAEKRKALEAEAEKRRKEADAASAKAETKEAVAASVVSQVIEAKVENRGISGVEKWRATVTDKKAFIAWVMEKGALEYVQIDEKLLTKEAQNTKGARSWPGVKTEKYFEARMRSK